MQKIQSGVVINFEKTGPDPPPTEGKGGSVFCSYIFKCLCYLSILVGTNIGGLIDTYTGTSKKKLEYGEKVHFFPITYFKKLNYHIF